MNDQTVLLIDDDKAVARIVAEFLEAAGYRTLVASSGAEGLAVAKSEQPALVICDASMPNMRGEEVIRILKQTPATAAIPTVLMSGYHDSDVGLGDADAFLGKPFQMTEAIRTVQSLLANASHEANRTADQL